jgi:uncharacterized protein YjiS (DUF1127 family)
MRTEALKLNNRSALVRPRAVTSLAARLLAKLVWIQHWMETCRDRRILLGMNDQQLKDIGISRGEIHGATRDGR